jgi:hypothetical protein
MVLNTSFNVRGEPMAHRPSEAVADYLHTGMDALVMGDGVAEKAPRPGWSAPGPKLKTSPLRHGAPSAAPERPATVVGWSCRPARTALSPLQNSAEPASWW